MKSIAGIIDVAIIAVVWKVRPIDCMGRTCIPYTFLGDSSEKLQFLHAARMEKTIVNERLGQRTTGRLFDISWGAFGDNWAPQFDPSSDRFPRPNSGQGLRHNMQRLRSVI